MRNWLVKLLNTQTHTNIHTHTNTHTHKHTHTQTQKHTNTQTQGEIEDVEFSGKGGLLGTAIS